MSLIHVVVATAKVQIFKQITTDKDFFALEDVLLLLPQRYKFSSKSQPTRTFLLLRMVVVATAKVQIFKQITTCLYVILSKNSCCCYRKGTNFQANHNKLLDRSCAGTVVVATAKVQIFKQITTFTVDVILHQVLLLLPQRYKFSSKSQLQPSSTSSKFRCCCYRKGTNFQANHNQSSSEVCGVYVVVATAKVQIFKQITTSSIFKTLNQRCCCYRKGTNFQANHN